MRRVIFLDFDGVLNVHAWSGMMMRDPSKKPVYLRQPLQADHVQRLNAIWTATGAEVVLSTAWRVKGLKWCQETLAKAGYLGPVVDRTPVHGVYDVRGVEIRAWLEKQPEHVAYICLDDDRSASVAGNHLLINGQDGLLDKHVPLAIEMLARDVARIQSFSRR